MKSILTSIRRHYLLLAILLALLLFVLAPCFASTVEYSTTNGVIRVTNTSATAWLPNTVFVVFPSNSTGTLSIQRKAHNLTVPLAGHTFSNQNALTWLPETTYPIRQSDVLTITSSVKAFATQIEKNP